MSVMDPWHEWHETSVHEHVHDEYVQNDGPPPGGDPDDSSSSSSSDDEARKREKKKKGPKRPTRSRTQRCACLSTRTR